MSAFSNLLKHIPLPLTYYKKIAVSYFDFLTTSYESKWGINWEMSVLLLLINVWSHAGAEAAMAETAGRLLAAQPKFIFSFFQGTKFWVFVCIYVWILQLAKLKLAFLTAGWIYVGELGQWEVSIKLWMGLSEHL